jgi:hypothetical protein
VETKMRIFLEDTKYGECIKISDLKKLLKKYSKDEIIELLDHPCEDHGLWWLTTD